MAKGQEAKERVIKKIAEAFGADYVGEYDKKIYVWSMEDGAKKQVALSLTCPSTPVGTVTTTGFDFENMTPTVAPSTFTPAEITQEEAETLEAMMKRLGL
jgi:hypothetical protein